MEVGGREKSCHEFVEIKKSLEYVRLFVIF